MSICGVADAVTRCRGVCLEDDKGCLVPPNTDLVYDVTLVRVAPSPLP
jgi:hypothetical protein